MIQILGVSLMQFFKGNHMVPILVFLKQSHLSREEQGSHSRGYGTPS